MDSAPGHRTGPPLALQLCPGPENPAPSRPFERWILLTYLAALASRVESWVLPDRVGLAFVTLGQLRILPEPGECASVPRESSCPQCPDPGWPHWLGLSAMLGTEQRSRCIFACVSAVPSAAEGVTAARRVGFFGVGVVLCAFACLPFKARLLFRISSAWVGKWHPTTVAGEG